MHMHSLCSKLAKTQNPRSPASRGSQWVTFNINGGHYSRLPTYEMETQNSKGSFVSALTKVETSDLRWIFAMSEDSFLTRVQALKRLLL